VQIKDIRLSDVARGLNWRLIETDQEGWWDKPMEKWQVERAEPLRTTDHAVYSGVYVLANGQVEPLLLLKEVSSIEYGGDYCEYVDGKWRQVGLEPNPDAPIEIEYFANPPADDPSFIGECDHAWHAKNLAAYVGTMRQD
jgi:hypothetical protein